LKATGIVRRIDELGRIVIPKEIRRTLRIREGDPLEIFTDRGGEVILKKYSPVGELSGFAAELAQALNQTSGLLSAVCDKDSFIAAAGISRKELLEQPLSPDLEQAVQGKATVVRSAADGGMLRITGAKDTPNPYTAMALCPILSLGDAIGAVLVLSKEQGAAIEPSAVKECELIAAFLSKLMDE